MGRRPEYEQDKKNVIVHEDTEVFVTGLMTVFIFQYLLTAYSLVFTVPTSRFNTNSPAFCVRREVCVCVSCASQSNQRLFLCNVD